MKKSLILSCIFVFLSASICLASDVKIIKSESYSLSLESVLIKANTSYSEIFDIDSIGEKIPDQILATVETGDWVSNVPSTDFVSDQDGINDKITEYWDISFAQVSNGNVIFIRTISNTDTIDRNSYTWNIIIKAKYLKYK